MPPLSLTCLKNTSTPFANGSPTGIATGPEYGEIIPRVIVLLATSTPRPVLSPLPLPLFELLLAQPESAITQMAKIPMQAKSVFLVSICCTSLCHIRANDGLGCTSLVAFLDVCPVPQPCGLRNAREKCTTLQKS